MTPTQLFSRLVLRNLYKHLFYRAPPVTAFVCWSWILVVKTSYSVLLNSLCEDIIQQVIANITCTFQSKNSRKLWIHEWYNSTPLSFVFTSLYLSLICPWVVFTRLHWPLNCLHSSSLASQLSSLVLPLVYNISNNPFPLSAENLSAVMKTQFTEIFLN